jgi:hypothetical protein
MVMMPVSTNGLNQLPKRYYPHGTAMKNTMQQVSGAIGTALLVTIMSIRTKFHEGVLEEQLVPSGTTPEALEVWSQQIMMTSMLEGINDAFFTTVFFSVVAFILAAFIKRSKPAEDSIKEADITINKTTKLVENS